MNPARIAERLAPFLDDASDQPLTTDDLQRISTYIDILIRWNARINLTAVRDPEEIVTRHFGESFFTARILFPDREGGRAVLDGDVNRHEQTGTVAQNLSNGAVSSVAKIALADVGSGAGFPGIPIKLWHPTLALTLIESNHKKAAFLREAARALTLTDINILAARAESIPPAAFNIVTLRAVEHFESILPITARLVAPAGRLAILIGTSQLPLAHSILEKIDGFSAQRAAASPMPLSTSRMLLTADRSS